MYRIWDRRGSSALPAVWIIGAIFGISVVAGLLRGNVPGGGFFAHASRAISKTLADVFRHTETKPAFEIDFGASTSSASSFVATGEKNLGIQKKIPSAAPVILGSEGAPIMQSRTPQAKNEIVALEPASSSIVEVKNNFGAKDAGAPQAAAPLCDFTSGKIPNHKILINEIAWMGNASSATNEWIEVRNNSGADISLSGWQIKNQDESLKINFSGGDSISSGGLYLLERTDDNAVPNIHADKIYVGTLSNGGEWIRVFDKNCGLVDDVNASDGWPGGDKSTKKTLERNVYDFEWHTSAQSGGTPRAKNLETIFVMADAPPQPPGGNSNATTSDNSSFVSSSTSTSESTSSQTGTSSQATSHILITEVMAGKTGASDYEFVELFNTGPDSVDLTNWTLKKRSSTGAESSLATASHFDGKTINAHKHFLAVNGGGYAGSVAADIVWPKSYTLAYASNTVALYDAAGAKVDEASWTSIPADQSYERDPVPGAPFAVEPNPNPQNSASN